MKIAIVGAGAVGGYFGARLAMDGHDVVFIARGDTLASLRAGGLRVDSILGDIVLPAVVATDDPTTVGQVDVVLLAVKSWQVAEATQVLRPLVNADTLILPLQNGVDSPRQLAEHFAKENVLGGMCKIGSRVLAPGRIEHFAIAPFVAFGYPDCRRSAAAEDLQSAFRAAGVTAELSPNVRVPMWEKFVLIAPWSGLGAVTRAPIGVLRELPKTRAMLITAMEEVAAVAGAIGVGLSDDVVVRTVSFVDSVAANATASMQRDIHAGKRSELMAQTGAVVRLGAEVGCLTPMNDFFLHSLEPLELRAEGKVKFEPS